MNADQLLADRLKPSLITLHHSTVPPGLYSIEELRAGPPVWRVVLLSRDGQRREHVDFHSESAIWPELKRTRDNLGPVEVRSAVVLEPSEIPMPRAARIEPGTVAVPRVRQAGFPFDVDDRNECVNALHELLRLAGDAIQALIEKHGCRVRATVTINEGNERLTLHELTGEIDVEVHAIELLEPSKGAG